MLKTPSGKPDSIKQLAQPHRRQRHLFRRLEHERVAAGDRDRKHPERHHRREVERRDPDADADRMADRLAVDLPGDVGERLAHEQAGNAAGELDHLDAALDRGPRFGERLAVLARDQAASSSACAASRSRNRNITRARSTTGVSAQAGKAAAAACTARSTSSAVQNGTWAITLPVDGLNTGPDGLDRLGSQRPPIEHRHGGRVASRSTRVVAIAVLRG